MEEKGSECLVLLQVKTTDLAKGNEAIINKT